MIPVGMNIAVFPTRFHIMSRGVSNRNRLTRGIRFRRNGNAVAGSNTSGWICPLTDSLGKKTNRMITARLMYMSRSIASRPKSIFLFLIQTMILTSSQIAVKISSSVIKWIVIVLLQCVLFDC